MSIHRQLRQTTRCSYAFLVVWTASCGQTPAESPDADVGTLFDAGDAERGLDVSPPIDALPVDSAILDTSLDAANIDAPQEAGAESGIDAGWGDPHTIVDVGFGIYEHACALFADGSVRCWGDGTEGELGIGRMDRIGDDEPASAGSPVVLSRRATALAVGQRHTCALLEGGVVQCWGFGLDGELGYGVATNVGDDETPASYAFTGARGRSTVDRVMMDTRGGSTRRSERDRLHA